jgi:hypothetical protein
MQQTKIHNKNKRIHLIYLSIFFLFCTCSPNHYQKKLKLLGDKVEIAKYFQFHGMQITVNFDKKGLISIDKMHLNQISKRLSCINLETFQKVLKNPQLVINLPTCSRSSFTSGFDLKGIRIAIDPGHSANSFKEGVYERKFISFVSSSQSIQFYESELNFKTALIMKHLLEEKGAKVFVTRLSEGFPGPAYFKKWLNDDYKADLKKLSENGVINEKKASLFKALNQQGKYLFFQKYIERPWRAMKINEFKPHLTFMLHYNATGYHGRDKADKYNEIKKVLSKNLDNKDKLKLISAISKRTHIEKENYSMVFIPGTFMENELSDHESRLHFLRLLLTNDLENSTILSKILIQKFEKNINIKPVDSWYGELRNNQPTAYKGVFARNLGMTRMVLGPIAFGEPFLQNNKKAIELIKEPEINFAGLRAAPILIKTAQAYVEAAEEFIKLKQRAEKFN